jgi:hypothetical protein
MRLLGFRHPRPVTDWTTTTYEETPTMIDTDEVGTGPLPGFESPETDPIELALAKLDPSLRTESVRTALQDQQRRLGIIAEAQEAVSKAKADLDGAMSRGSGP